MTRLLELWELKLVSVEENDMPTVGFAAAGWPVGNGGATITGFGDEISTLLITFCFDGVMPKLDVPSRPSSPSESEMADVLLGERLFGEGVAVRLVRLAVLDIGFLETELLGLGADCLVPALLANTISSSTTGTGTSFLGTVYGLKKFVIRWLDGTSIAFFFPLGDTFRGDDMAETVQVR